MKAFRLVAALVALTYLGGCANMSKEQKIALGIGVGILAVAAIVVGAKNGAFDGWENWGSGSGTTTRSYNGNCQYDYQRAADGSRCGKRSAASRPGGWPW